MNCTLRRNGERLSVPTGRFTPPKERVRKSLWTNYDPCRMKAFPVLVGVRVMTSLVDVLQRLHERATQDLNTPAVKEAEILERIDYVCRCLSNRAGVRLLMACLLAKLDNSRIDPRQPYTEIGGEQSVFPAEPSMSNTSAPSSRAPPPLQFDDGISYSRLAEHCSTAYDGRDTGRAACADVRRYA